MDHFNATVHNGNLVHTRRGLQVSKQKFNGLSFVNSSPQTFDTPASSRRKSPEAGQQREFKFVSKNQEPKGDGSSKKRRKGNSDSLLQSSSQGTPQAKLGRRRVSKDQMSTTSSVSSPSSRKSSESLSPTQSEGYSTPNFTSAQPLDLFTPPVVNTAAASLPSSWPSPDLPTYMSAEQRKQFQHYFAYVARRIYPYEDILTHNPVGSNDHYYMLMTDPAALHCVLMTGAIAEMIINQGNTIKGFAYHISKICAILNRKLGQNKGIDPVAVECILALALMGTWLGRLDHWYMHMRGLQNVMEVNGGLNGLSPELVSKIHTTDLKGAVALATTPYVAFTRSYSPVSAIVPAQTRNHASTSLTELLTGLRIAPVVITSLQNLSVFSFAVQMALATVPPPPASPGSLAAESQTMPPGHRITFDPLAFNDELHGVTYDLLMHPTPLRDPSTASGPFNPFNPPSDRATIPSATANIVDDAQDESYFPNHRIHVSGGFIMPSPLEEDGDLEPALRIAGLLFLKELLPEWPRNVGGYGILLDLLTTHLRGVLSFDRYTTSAPLFDASGQQQQQQQYPYGLEGKGKAPLPLPPRASASRARGFPRPVVLWLCVLGNLMSLIADKNENRVDESTRYDRSIFRECLVAVAGVASPGDVDRLPEEDFRLFRLLDIRTIQGDEWDDRTALKALLLS